MSRTIKLSDTLQSVFEVEIGELAADPDGFGLDADEAKVKRLLAAAVTGDRFAIPDDVEASALMRAELVDMANAFDDVVIGKAPGDGDERKFARFARDGLGALANRIARAGARA